MHLKMLPLPLHPPSLSPSLKRVQSFLSDDERSDSHLSPYKVSFLTGQRERKRQREEEDIDVEESELFDEFVERKDKKCTDDSTEKGSERCVKDRERGNICKRLGVCVMIKLRERERKKEEETERFTFL